MLAMYFVGVVLLFTYFRFQYPNIGRHDEGRPHEQAPEISVLVSDALMPRVEKVARSYELEFGVRVLLETAGSDFSGADESDLLVRSESERFPADIGIAHRISFPSFSRDFEPAGESRWELGARAVSDSRRDGAVRLARYLSASDRGLPIVFPDENLEMADPWALDPTPTIVVWEGAFPLLRSALRDFEQMEGSKLSLVVGDCLAVSQKMGDLGGVDGIVVFDGICQSSEEPGWDEVVMTQQPLIVLSSVHRGAILGDGVSVEGGALMLGLLPGMSAALEKPGCLRALPRSFQDLIQQGKAVQFSRSNDLIRGILNDPRLVGISLFGSVDERNKEVKAEPVLESDSVFELRMRISQESSYRHMLLRLRAFLARGAKIEARIAMDEGL